MTLNDRDLFRRRPVAAATSIRGPSDRSSNIRRRKRHARKEQAVLLAVVAVVATSGLLAIVARNGAKKSSTDVTSIPSLTKWEPLRIKKTSADIILHNNDEKASAFKGRYHGESLQDDDENTGELYRYKFSASELGYDIHNCPSTPPDDYPRAWPVTDIISNWNPNEVTTILPKYREVYHSLCIFDYQTQYEAAVAYRDAEKPFLIRNDPKVTAASKKWSEPGYLLDVLPSKKIYTERSPVNHFLFYNQRQRKNYKNWVQPPNDIISMRYDEWLERALERDAIALADKELMKRVDVLKAKRIEREKSGDEEEIEQPEDDEVQEDGDREDQKRLNWYYWRLNAFVEQEDKDEMSKMTFDDMPFFDPRKEEQSKFYLVDPTDQRGINCRFGMRGIIAESHADLSRNMLALLDGERRYIIGHPNQCENLYLYPRNHPSGRHASFDWSNPTNWDLHPKIYNALHSEVVMRPGDVLYLPTAWFHHIVNLSANIQCNIRSGISYENKDIMKECGFKLPKQR